jgi:hypothetical protein
VPQHSWNITGHRGNHFTLNLFHGDTTQHVILHCNSRIVQIDFEVRESRTYTLFLDQELCEVSIDHTGGDHYDYSCRINHEAETPLNKYRKDIRHRQTQMERTRIVLGGLVLLALFCFVLACNSV